MRRLRIGGKRRRRTKDELVMRNNKCSCLCVTSFALKNRNNPLLSTLPNDVINCNDRSNYTNIIFEAIGRKGIDKAALKLSYYFFIVFARFLFHI